MRDIINAGVDPHRWFAGVRDGLIDSDTSFARDPEKVKAMSAFLAENVSKEARQHAKAANFGFPGGLSAHRFMVNCREQGIVISESDAQDLRSKWIATFSEMQEHMQPTEVLDVNAARMQYGAACLVPDDEDDDDEQDDDTVGKKLYVATLINGMVRNNCTYCAALNVQFQGLAAFGAKLAMWNLALAGFLPRLVNFIHDEVVYWLYPEEMKEAIPIVEECMISGMNIALPDVRVGVETTCMLHWDKKAKEFGDLEWTDTGYPILEEPAFVQQALGVSK